MHYQKALAWIHSLYRFGSKPGLERIEALLNELGNPQKELNCIHITGTNGKGSTAAMLAAMLKEQGLRVGLYTSPYLEAFTNRMAVDGSDIAEDDLARLVSRVKPLVEKVSQSHWGQPTEFEVVTALAFLYFAEKKPDYVVVEVGLGGRLDATNVIRPAVSVITNVGLEHTQVLGDTIAAIAGEKAGIIKEGVPVITAARKEEALAVIEEAARVRHAPLYRLDRDFFVTPREASLFGQTFDYKSDSRALLDLEIPLAGRHQLHNAAVALAALERLPLPFDEQAVRRGLRKTAWPGRLEVFSADPLILVDGAHNPDGILALRQALAELAGDKPLVLILGILADKAVEEILSLIVPLATKKLILTRPQNPRAADPAQVAGLAKKYTGVPVCVIDDIFAATAAGVKEAGKGEALCISGSLYTISEARAALKSILSQQTG